MMGMNTLTPSRLAILVLPLMLAWGCQQAPTPSATNPQTNQDNANDDTKAYEETGSGDYTALDTSEAAACMQACQASGLSASECQSLSWGEGGCGPVVDAGPQGDPILIPVGYQKVAGSVEFCMHNREDYLIAQDGVLSFTPQRGLSLADVKKSGGLFSAFSISNLITQFMPLWSATGNMPAGIPGSGGFKNRATVILDGVEKEWPYPGAIPFSFAPMLGERADLSSPLIFAKTGVKEDGDALHRAFKGVDKQVHYQNYYGAGRHIDIVKFRKEPMIGFIGDRFPTNCRFKLEFDLHFKPL